jgi:hypothetical protein
MATSTFCDVLCGNAGIGSDICLSVCNNGNNQCESACSGLAYYPLTNDVIYTLYTNLAPKLFDSFGNFKNLVGTGTEKYLKINAACTCIAIALVSSFLLLILYHHSIISRKTFGISILVIIFILLAVYLLWLMALKNMFSSLKNDADTVVTDLKSYLNDPQTKGTLISNVLDAYTRNSCSGGFGC